MKFLTSGLHLIKEMRPYDISIYKIYLFALGLLLAALVPWFGTVHPLLWLVIGIVLLGYLMTFTYKKRDDAKGYIDTVLANFHDYSLADAITFELGIIALGLAAYHYIPRFQTLDTNRYLGIFIFGLAWITSMWAH